MPSLADTLGSIPGYAGVQASRARNRLQEQADLQQFGTLQNILTGIQKQEQARSLMGATPEQMKDPDFWSRLAITQNKPEYETHAERLRGERRDATELETMRGKRVPVQVASGAGVAMPQGERTGGIFDDLAQSENPQIAQQAKAMKASMETSTLPPKYWQTLRTQLGARETALLNRPEEPLHPIVGDDGKPVLVRRSDAVGKTPYNPSAVSLTTAGDLSPEATRDLAIQSLYDPNALAGYRRDPKMMSRIANERIKVMRESGVTSEDVVSGRAGFKADTMSLNKITPQYDAITAFENTAIRNGKILVDLANKVDTTGIPVAERWIRAGRSALAGDPDVSNFNAQMNLYRAEAARILTQPNLSGVLTDTARKEMEHVIANDASARQIKSVVALLERDFGNRKHTLEEQISAIRARMRGRVAPGGGEAPTPTPAPAAPTSGWSIRPL